METPPEKATMATDMEKEPIPGISADAMRSGSVPDTILKHSHDADAALKAFSSYQGQVLEISEETNRKLLRKIDWHLMPILCIVYGLNYLDKTTISYASIMGIKNPPNADIMKSGIGITGNQYSWLGR